MHARFTRLAYCDNVRVTRIIRLMTADRPLTDKQREALLILLRSREGVDRSNRVTQGVWNSLRKRGLTIYRRPFDRLTDKGRRVAESLES